LGVVGWGLVDVLVFGAGDGAAKDSSPGVL